MGEGQKIMPRLRFSLTPLILTAVLAATGVRAAEQPMSSAARVREKVLRMSEFFDTMLPGVLQENNVTLHFTPKFVDLRDHEYIRYPLELRYGATENLELRGGFTPFTPNPFNSGREHRWGLGEAKFGLRYDINGTLPFFDDTTLGFELRSPLGVPPTTINDHYTHVKPFVSSARYLRMWPDVTFYTNLSYDRSVELTRRDAPPPWVTRRNIIELSPGLLFKPGEFGYFGEYHWRHITEPNEWHLEHEVRVGSIWDIPKSRTEGWKLPGKWQLELAYEFTKEEGRGDDHGVSARVNWRTSLREVLNHTAKQSK
jgi:hypothetical protein